MLFFLFEYVFFLQSKHVFVMVECWCFPAPHLEQLGLPLGEIQPAGQKSHRCCALLLANMFSLHSSQIELPFCLLIVPGMHPKQLALLLGEILPAVQLIHPAAPALDAFPAMHGSQALFVVAPSV